MIVLALDVGSTSAKADVFDAAGADVGHTARRPVPVAPDGTADAVALAEAVERVMDEAVAALPRRPDAVALTTAWHGLVGLGADGRPTTSLSTWMDPRASLAAAGLAAALADAEATRRRTGAPVHPSFPAARLWRVAHDEPDVFAATRRWCSIGEWLELRWFGEAGPSSSMASGTGLYDQDGARWDGELLDVLGLAEGALAPVTDEPHRALREPYRDRWPVLDGLPFFPALGDGACALVGSGCTDGRRAALSLGTSAAVRVLVPRAVAAERPPPRPLFRYLLDRDRAVVGGARSNAGNLVAWARRELRLDGDDPVAVVTAGRPPGGHGLAVDPSFAGERSPSWPARAAGSVGGLRLETTAHDVLQALVEAAAAGIGACAAVLEEWVGEPIHLVALGGGATPGWRRLLADVTGRPVRHCDVEEATARGAAIVALERLGAVPEGGLPPLDGPVTGPDADRARAYAALAGG